MQPLGIRCSFLFDHVPNLMTAAPLPPLDRPDVPAADPDEWVDRYGDLLLGYAMRQVADRTAAEDVVQETLLAAWQARESFRGDSKFETWLIGILRRKACDYLRRSGREVASLDVAGDGLTSPETASHFSRSGQWQTRPQRWSTLPADSIENEEFWAAVQHCIGDLPDHFAEAFRLRIASGKALREISSVLGISTDHLSVRLHRARLLLRDCLSRRWFEEAKPPRQTPQDRTC